MSEDSTPMWPEPSDWAQRLYDRLEQLGDDYTSTSWKAADDPDEFAGLNLKQARAAEILLAIHTALRELPPFEKSKGAAALHDIASAMRDVVMGGSPRLFASVRPGSPGGDGIDRNYVRLYVVLAVNFLVEAHGVSSSPAYRQVAEIFAKAGATGRKGGALSASTVQTWCERTHALSSNHEDVRLYQAVESKMEVFRAQPEWPGNFEASLAWIQRIASHPLLTSKYD